MDIEADGFETVHVTGSMMKASRVEDDPLTDLTSARNTIQDALNLMALGDNTQARAILEAYLKEGK
jgi:hypothetical protein